jgi:hypothetical protein
VISDYVATDSALVWSSQVAPLPLAIFCYQVFFVYDPSSSTSLLSSADARKSAKTNPRTRERRRHTVT